MATNQGRIPPFEKGYEGNPESVNRATQMRRDNDTVKTPKVSLYDIDYAILFHLAQNMKLQVMSEGRMIQVPVLYADGEKWAQIRARGFLRDQQNKVMAPMIAIRRTNVEPDSRIPIIDLNNYVPHHKFFPYKTMNMQYDKLSGQLLRKPSYEFYMVDVPNYVRVSYDLILWTNTVEQMNPLVQAVVATANHMWGDFYTFRTDMTSANMNNTNDAGSDRIVSTTISLLVDGYLQEEFEYHEPTIRKAFSTKTVDFKNDQEQFNYYIEEPSTFSNIRHTTQEPKHIQRMNKRRNLRYR